MSIIKHLEFCVTEYDGALLAAEHGAKRIELCSDLSIGGVTPSHGLIDSCADVIETHVLVRPRGGDFCHDQAELEIMFNDIIQAHHAGATGVVFGVLLEDGKIDIPANSYLIDFAKQRKLVATFHRAFDQVKDPKLALEEVIKMGFQRILTSGTATSALEGKEILKDLVKQAAGRIEIMAGGGVGPDHAAELINIGVNALHCSIHNKATSSSPMGARLSYNLEKISGMVNALNS